MRDTLSTTTQNDRRVTFDADLRTTQLDQAIGFGNSLLLSTSAIKPALETSRRAAIDLQTQPPNLECLLLDGPQAFSSTVMESPQGSYWTYRQNAAIIGQATSCRLAIRDEKVRDRNRDGELLALRSLPQSLSAAAR